MDTATYCCVILLCITNIWATEGGNECQNALNNLISHLGTTTNNTSDNLVFMPPTFSVDIVSLLRWAVETQTQQSDNNRPNLRSQVEQTNQRTFEHFYPQSFLNLVQFNGKSYMFSKNQKFTWIESLVFCRSFGMDLVSIETAEEDNFIVQQLTTMGTLDRVYWTSGNKIGRSTFLWMNGERLIYENWYPGEPGAPAAENCIVLSTKKWHDWPCHQNTQHTYQTFFICEAR